MASVSTRYAIGMDADTPQDLLGGELLDFRIFAALEFA
jgi:hypothetical protein